MTSSSPNDRATERRLIELSDLLEISQTLNRSLDLDTILNQLVLAAMGRFAVGRGLFLLSTSGDGFEVIVSKGLGDLRPGAEIDLPALPELPVLVEEADDAYRFFAERRLAVVIPLWSGGRCVGILALGSKLTGQPYEPHQLDFLRSLASVATPAIENSRVYTELQHLNTRLDQKIHELNTLFELGKRFVGTLDASEVLRLFSYALMGQLLLTRYLMVLRRPNDQTVVEARGITLDEPHKWDDEGFWELLESLESPVRIDPDTHGPLHHYGLTAVVSIRKESKTYGFVGFGARPSKPEYTDDELAIGSALANQVVISLENAWLIEETIEKRRLEEELSIASRIHSKLFPKHLPAVDRYQLSGRSTPTRHVGGDYYDAISLDNGRVLIAIADVSGKGVPAALLMSNVQASLRALAEPGMDLAASAARINEIIYTNTDFNKYATFFYGILDPREHSFVYTNAGHNPPIVLRDGGAMELLEAGGLPVGLMPGSEYEQGLVHLGPNDIVVLYTDGVNEAANKEGDEFGTDRLERLLIDNCADSAENLIACISTAIDEFAAGVPQGDDITLFVVKRLG